MRANRDQTSQPSKKAKVDTKFPPERGYEIVPKDPQNQTRFFSYSTGFNRRYRHLYRA